MIHNTIPENISYGVYKFKQLIALRENPIQAPWVRDEADLIEALEIARSYFPLTEGLLGKKMYQGQPYDFVDDVKLEVEEFLFTANNPDENQSQRRRNVIMYHLVVAPVIDLFKTMDHETALKEFDEIFENVVHEVYSTSIECHYDDALVARVQISQMVREREAIRKAELAAKKKRKKRKKHDLSWMLTADKEEQPAV